MNKGVKAIIGIIACLWIFFVGLEIGNFKQTRGADVSETDTEQTLETVLTAATQATTAQTTAQTTAAQSPTTENTTAQTTEAKTTEEATQEKTTAALTETSATASQTETTQTTAAPQESTTAETQPSTEAPAQTTQPVVTTVPVTVTAETNTQKLLNELSKAVNDTKNYTGSFIAQYNQVRELDIVNCSVPRATSTVDSLVKNFIGGGTGFSYKFSGGKGIDQNGKTVTPKDVIPPRFGSKQFSIDEGGISSIQVKKVAGGKKYKLSLIPETATLKNPPVYNYNSIGYLDLSGLNIITSADFNYSGSVIEATVGSNGMLSSLHIYMPITGTGKGRVLGFTGTATFEGSVDETWGFSY